MVRYPAYFTDGEADSRARIEQLLHAKSGRGREYHFEWDEEGNQLTVTVLPPLPTDIAAQRFVTSPGETVLGFTDPSQVQRTLPLSHGEERRDVPPVVWRTGPRSTEPHLLVMGEPGSGTTTLLRSIALQALQYGDILIVEGSGTGEYACLTGRNGVLAVECAPTGALASLEWAAHETERRLIAANRARQAGQPLPDDTRRPLWLLLDRPGALAHLAAADGRRDPQSLLQVPLRHGRAANVTVVVAEQFDSADTLTDAVRQHTRARVVLGPASPAQLEGILAHLRTRHRSRPCPRAAATPAWAQARSTASRSRPPRIRTTKRRATPSGRRSWICCRRERLRRTRSPPPRRQRWPTARRACPADQVGEQLRRRMNRQPTTAPQAGTRRQRLMSPQPRVSS